MVIFVIAIARPIAAIVSSARLQPFHRHVDEYRPYVCKPIHSDLSTKGKERMNSPLSSPPSPEEGANNCPWHSFKNVRQPSGVTEFLVEATRLEPFVEAIQKYSSV